MTKPRCRVCGYVHRGYKLELSYSSKPENFAHSLELVPEEPGFTIAKAVHGYCRWIAEGEPAYGHDNWKSFIEFIGDHTYNFRIQIEDSPEGDTWIVGAVKFYHAGNMEILHIKEEAT